MWIKLRFLKKLVGAAYIQVRSIDRKLRYICVCVYMFVCVCGLMPAYVCLPVSLSLSLPLSLSLCLSLCLCLSLSLCLSVCLSLSFSLYFCMQPFVCVVCAYTLNTELCSFHVFYRVPNCAPTQRLTKRKKRNWWKTACNS